MLQLVHDTQPESPHPSRPPVDRRAHPRRRTAAQVTAMRRSHDPAAYRQPFCSLAVRDLSESGIAATSSVPLHLDEPVTLYFSPHANEPGFELCGHVVRCRPAPRGDAHAAEGYEVAICFDPFDAA